MTTFTALVSTSLVMNGLFAGMCFDIATVKLPTRKRIGSVAYANFARNNDLGYGLRIYPYVFILSVLLSIATAMVVTVSSRTSADVFLTLAGCMSVACAFFTSKAGPIMWSLRKTADDEALLTRKLNGFAFWHTWRTACQIAAFVLTCVAVIIL